MYCVSSVSIPSRMCAISKSTCGCKYHVHPQRPLILISAYTHYAIRCLYTFHSLCLWWDHYDDYSHHETVSIHFSCDLSIFWRPTRARMQNHISAAHFTLLINILNEAIPSCCWTYVHVPRSISMNRIVGWQLMLGFSAEAWNLSRLELKTCMHLYCNHQLYSLRHSDLAQ